MAEFVLGTIGFDRLEDGGIGVGQHWNPSLIPAKDRRAIAEVLMEIAAQMYQDRFENAGKYRTYKSPAKRKPAVRK